MRRKATVTSTEQHDLLRDFFLASWKEPQTQSTSFSLCGMFHASDLSNATGVLAITRIKFQHID